MATLQQYSEVFFQSGLENLLGEMDKAAAQLPGPSREILMGTRHENLRDALLADLVDVVPIVGDLSNLMRVRDTMKRGVEYSKRRLPAQVVDLLLGVLPEPYGAILDAATPTNTITFLRERGWSEGLGGNR